MTEFINHKFISQEEENTCEMDCNIQAPNDQQSESNQPANQCQSMENPDLTSEKLEKLFQDKLYLVERGKDLRKLALDLLEENKRLNREREQKEKTFIKNEKNAKIIAEVINSRLTYVYELCSERRKVYKDYMTCSLKRLQEATLLNNENKVLLQERQSILEAMFATIEEQLETLETLKKPNYETLCLENVDCFETVMSACTRLEESCYELTSMILQDNY